MGKIAFLVTEPPAVLLNEALIDQNDELKEQIQELKNKQLAKRERDTKKIKALEQKLAKQKKYKSASTVEKPETR